MLLLKLTTSVVYHVDAELNYYAQETDGSVRFGSVPDQASSVPTVPLRHPIRPVPVRLVRVPTPRNANKK